MNYKEVIEKIDGYRREHGKSITNIILGAMRNDLKYDIIEKKNGLIIIGYEAHRKRGYFMAEDVMELKMLLQDMPRNIFFEWIYRDVNILKEVERDTSLTLYETYFRISDVWTKNPYEVPEEGRKRILQELYDSSCGEYAVEQDAEELYNLSKSVFDTNCDDVFTVEEWEKRILKKEVLVYREDNKITSCYVWRLEGRKLYSNISINLGAANILYNMERRIFTEMWKKGIRTYYAWYNEKNKKELARRNRNAYKYILREDIIHNAIYQS